MTDTIAAPRRAPLFDEDLVAKARVGQAEAFATLMRRYNRRLFRAAFSILRNEAEAEDAVQEAYLRAFAGLDGLQEDASFAAWLLAIAVNEARARLRRAQRFGALDDRDLRAEAPMFTVPPASPERLATTAELRRVLEAAIGTLPGPFRIVFMLRGVEQLSVEETARCLGIPPATVKTRFHRARARLRALLQEEAASAMPELFAFDGARCDRIVANVRARLRASGLIM